MRRHPSSAFTLIELLVVISIVGLLVAILLPSLRSARIASQQTASLSNLRQIAMAAVTYASDNKGSLPYSQRAWFNTGGNKWDTQLSQPRNYWAGQLVYEGYVATPRLFWPTGRPTGAIDPANPVTVGGFSQYRYTGYAANAGAMGNGEHLLLNWRDKLGAASDQSIQSMPLRLGEANSPAHSNFALFIEGDRADIPEQGMFLASPRLYTQTGANVFICYNYRGATPRVYVDGHALSMKRDTSKLTHSNAAASPATLVAPTPNDLAWDPDRPTNLTGITPPASFNGWWAVGNSAVRSSHAPWYLNWRVDGFN